MYTLTAVATLQELWPKKLPNLKWIHSCSAGVESFLWPELSQSDVIVTNARVSPP